MKSTGKLLLSAILATSLASCASFKPEPRPAYTGADQVGAVDANMLIGTWQIKNLNPLPSEPSINAQITFNSDGSTSGYSKMDDGDSENPFGRMEMEMQGNWSVNGDSVNQTITSLEEVTGNPAAKFGIAIAQGFSKGKTQAGNVYEASADRLVIVNEEEGLAQLFTRVN